MTDTALSVGQLFRRSRNALARDFRGLVWVEGEIKALREQRGSLYLTLVDPGDYADGGDINLDVACWPKRNAVLQAQLRQAGVKLTAGMMVRIEGTITISKVGRLQVELARLDTEALVGRQESEKRRLVEALTVDGSIDRNRHLSSPLVPLRVGLVASEGSEGCNDFLGQLQRTEFAFAVTFRHSAVQGPTAAASLSRAIADLAGEYIDVIAVCRGGGGELDAFDKEAVVRAIAGSPVPVWTGIGHTGDSSLADRVANQSFITPTECGQALVRAVTEYVATVDDLAGRAHRLAERALAAEEAQLKARGRHLVTSVELGLQKSGHQLHRYGERAQRSADRDLALRSAQVDGYQKDLWRGASVTLQEASSNVGQYGRIIASGGRAVMANSDRDLRLWRSQLSALDPARQLRRGYTLTRNAEGKLITQIADVTTGSPIFTELVGGRVQSTVEAVEHRENKS